MRRNSYCYSGAPYSRKNCISTVKTVRGVTPIRKSVSSDIRALKSTISIGTAPSPVALSCLQALHSHRPIGHNPSSQFLETALAGSYKSSPQSLSFPAVKAAAMACPFCRQSRRSAPRSGLGFWPPLPNF